ncbi:MAG TPA: Gfo/Idh/MocA family oxidoreductase [Armatimonadaceae bacterium]|jgi:myo-inositol 2-dehydrogenase/D-chiro-inositol 1-dehydrogenase|nr:Gfo/Idh/MocA family oxidoreductase [Armatimonadaceae bacterium]
MSRLRIGVVGCGGIANDAHLPQLAERKEAAEVVGVADINPEAARKTAERWGIARTHADHHALLPDVDAVLVCTPTYTHAPIAIDALNAGKHVFCEKPMARTLDQAEAMRAASQKSGARLQVGFVRRFDDEWLAFGEALRAGAIGRPVVWRDVMSGPGPHWSPWFFQDEQGGGPFLDGAIHTIDFALHLFGPLAWVFTHGRTMGAGHTAVDAGSASLRFESGDELLLAWSWGLPVGCYGGRLFEILGPGGRIGWPGGEPQGSETRRFVVDRGEPGGREEVSFVSKSLTKGFGLQLDEFFAVARGEREPRSGAREGIEALRVVDALLRSARSGQPETPAG